MKISAVVTLALIVAGASIATAQYGAYPYPYHESRAATPGESHARGMSEVVRAQGQYNLATSQAAINATEVQRRNIQNREAWTSTYFEMRKANRAYRAAERRPRPTMEQLVRYAQAGKPKPLSPSELDTVTGKINWPMFLDFDQFAAGRTELEKIFGERAKSGVIGREDYTTVRKLTGSMLAELKKNVREIPPAQYTITKKFLQSLAYEAGLPQS